MLNSFLKVHKTSTTTFSNSGNNANRKACNTASQVGSIANFYPILTHTSVFQKILAVLTVTILSAHSAPRQEESQDAHLDQTPAVTYFQPKYAEYQPGVVFYTNIRPQELDLLEETDALDQDGDMSSSESGMVFRPLFKKRKRQIVPFAGRRRVSPYNGDYNTGQRRNNAYQYQYGKYPGYYRNRYYDYYNNAPYSYVA